MIESAAKVVKWALEEMNACDSKVPIVLYSRRIGITKGKEIKESFIKNIASPANFFKNLEYVLENGVNIY